jgi:hypothetical protein
MASQNSQRASAEQQHPSASQHPSLSQRAHAPLAVGLQVQWEPQGIRQFAEPATIEWISECGTWARVSGSSTGVPIAELTPFFSAEPKPIAPARRHRFPNTFIGPLLDHKPPKKAKGDKRHPLDSPRAGAYAIHAMGIKLARFDHDGGALNETYLAKHHGMGRRAARAAFHKLQKVGIISRRVAGATYADEKIIKDRGNGYVAFDPDWLAMSSEAFAFAMVVNLNPFPQRPAQACKRISITSKTKILAIVAEVKVAGAVAIHLGKKGCVLVARSGHIFDRSTDVPTSNVRSTDVPSCTSLETEHSSLEDEIPFTVNNYSSGLTLTFASRV